MGREKNAPNFLGRRLIRSGAALCWIIDGLPSVRMRDPQVVILGASSLEWRHVGSVSTRTRRAQYHVTWRHLASRGGVLITWLFGPWKGPGWPGVALRQGRQLQVAARFYAALTMWNVCKHISPARRAITSPQTLLKELLCIIAWKTAFLLKSNAPLHFISNDARSPWNQLPYLDPSNNCRHYASYTLLLKKHLALSLSIYSPNINRFSQIWLAHLVHYKTPILPI